MSNLNMSIHIAPLLSDDVYANIDNANSIASAAIINNNPMDVGIYFDIIRGEIVNSILDQSAETQITININSLVSNAINRSNNSTNRGLLSNSDDINLIEKITQFTKTLCGRPIIVYLNHIDIQQNIKTHKIVYQGYITSPPSQISVRTGTVIELTCVTLLGQLGVMSSNGSWNDATKKYDNIFSSVTANQVNFQQLMSAITSDTLCAEQEQVFINGSLKALPSKLWAAILPNEYRLPILKEILLPYSRLIYQSEEGKIIISPLFINDKADKIYNVDYLYNSDSNWLDIAGTNKASSIPNRIDVLFGTNVPIPMFGSPLIAGQDDKFASAPYISSNGLIESNGAILNYATIYKTSARLYNSGKFIMPLLKTLNIDNSIFTDTALLNSLTGIYNTQDLANSVIYSSNDFKINSIPLLYSQMYMALNNVMNYNATVIYDYLKVVDVPSPLGKIISIFNYDTLDYPDMIVTKTTLIFGVKTGTLFAVDTAPLLSITPVWGTI